MGLLDPVPERFTPPKSRRYRKANAFDDERRFTELNNDRIEDGTVLEMNNDE